MHFTRQEQNVSATCQVTTSRWHLHAKTNEHRKMKENWTLVAYWDIKKSVERTCNMHERSRIAWFRLGMWKSRGLRERTER
jgi:hypothetical protein